MEKSIFKTRIALIIKFLIGFLVAVFKDLIVVAAIYLSWNYLVASAFDVNPMTFKQAIFTFISAIMAVWIFGKIIKSLL